MANPGAPKPVAKKARLAAGRACEPCRRRKHRCDGKRPTCSDCDSRNIGRSCCYPADAVGAALASPPRDPEFDGRAVVQLHASDNSAAAAVSAAGHVMGAQPYCNDTALSPDEDAFYGDSSTFEFVSKLSTGNALTKRLPGHKNRGLELLEPRVEAYVPGLSLPGDLALDSDSHMPSREVAYSLVDAYFDRVHIFYPCLHEPTFRCELDAHWASCDPTDAVQKDCSWLAILHMLFAYGTEFVAANVNAEESHRLDAHAFAAQARRLITINLSRDTRLETVQALLLLSHYLQGTTELNDCWNISGLLIRAATSIGLHIDPSETLLSEVEKEVRKRVWAGCFIVDRTLSMKFGRPPAIPIASVKRVELPAVVDDQYITNSTSRTRQPQGRPSKMRFFVETIGQAHIIDDILMDLYLDESRLQRLGRSNNCSKTEALSRLLGKTVSFDGRLLGWWSNLPHHLREPPEEPDSIDFHRQRCIISLRFLHIRLLVHRQSFLIWSRSQIQDKFLGDVAVSSSRCCVSAACQVIQEIKENFDRQRLGSLWYILHYIFTSVGILLHLNGAGAKSAAVVDSPIDVESLRSWAMAFLNRWSPSNALAARYIFLLQQPEERLRGKTKIGADHASVAVCSGLTAYEPFNALASCSDPSNIFPWTLDTGGLNIDAWAFDPGSWNFSVQL